MSMWGGKEGNRWDNLLLSHDNGPEIAVVERAAVGPGTLGQEELDEFLEENQQRENDYQQLLGSFNLRIQVVAARKVIQQHPEMDDQQMLAKVQETHSKASLANVKEAKRLETKGGKMRMPIEPKRAADMPLYKSIYF